MKSDLCGTAEELLKINVISWGGGGVTPFKTKADEGHSVL